MDDRAPTLRYDLASDTFSTRKPGTTEWVTDTPEQARASREFGRRCLKCGCVHTEDMEYVNNGAAH